MLNEILLLRFLNGFPSNLMFLPYLISLLGSITFVLSIILVFWIIGKEDKGFMLFLSVIVTGAIVYGLKLLFKRKRPYLVVEGIKKFIEAGGYSFPSGHASLAFILATVLSGFYKKGKNLYFLAALIALSRIVLGVHYPTDVLAGSLLGIFIGKIFNRNKEKILDKFKVLRKKFSNIRS